MVLTSIDAVLQILPQGSECNAKIAKVAKVAKATRGSFHPHPLQKVDAQ